MNNPGVDVALAEWMATHRSPWANIVSGVAMYLGTRPAGILVTVAAVLLIGVVTERLRIVIVAFAATIVAAVTVAGLKLLIQRPRPPDSLALVETVGFSMPSTAAAITAAGAVALVPLALPRWRVLWGSVLVLLNVTVDVAVIYLGAHWLTDVVVGAIWGTLLGLLMLRATHRWWAAQRNTIDNPYSV